MTDHDAAHAGIRKHRWTRRFRAAGWSLAAALVLTIGVRTAVAQVYVVPTASIEPEIPQDSRVLVYKLASRFEPGQIVAYRHHSGMAWLGRVEYFDPATGSVTISCNGAGPTVVRGDAVIGRVVLGTR